jgi:glycerophosphoryl diester phosphodiesterase
MGTNQDRIQSLCERMLDLRPRLKPDPQRLKRVRVIAHRGVHDNRQVLENTLPAFQAASETGVWGIEFDIRWSNDDVPLVFHDADLARLTGSPARIGDFTAPQLRRFHPWIPTLREALVRFGQQLHLMIELKEEPYSQRRIDTLADHLAALTPGRNYHLMSFDRGLLDRLNFSSSEALLPIARWDVRQSSRWALERGYGGVSASQILLSRRTITRHHRAGQQVGTGFVDSKNTLFREATRGVDWVFSNRAAELVQWQRQYAAR